MNWLWDLSEAFEDIFGGLFGHPKVKQAPLDGTVPWSQTTININRIRARKRRRILLYISLILGACLLCAVCGAVSKFYTAQAQPTSAATQAQPTKSPTATPTRTPIPTPTSSPTPRPIISATVYLTGYPAAGAEITITVQADDEADVIAWWENVEPLAKIETSNLRASMRVTIPANAQPGIHLLIIEVRNEHSMDRQVIKVEL